MVPSGDRFEVGMVSSLDTSDILRGIPTLPSDRDDRRRRLDRRRLSCLLRSKVEIDACAFVVLMELVLLVLLLDSAVVMD